MAVQTKAKQVEEFIRQRISEGAWVPGDKLPSDKDLSGDLGVSYMTVKTVMSHLSNEGLLMRRKRMGTYVSESAATACIVLATRAENLSSSMGYYYRQMLQIARSEVSAKGLRPILLVGHGETDEEFRDSLHFFDTPIARQTVGAIIFGAPGEAAQAEFEKADINIVFARSALPSKTHATAVSNYSNLIENGIKVLREKGYRNYQLVHINPPTGQTDPDYYRQLRALVESAPGVEPHQVRWLPWGGWDYDGVYAEFKRIWAEEEHPDAFFFLDDAICDNALRALQELNVDIPGELGIMTQTNTGRHFNFPKSIDRLEFDPAEFMHLTINLLDDIVNQRKSSDVCVYVEPVYVPGQTLRK